MKNKILIPSFLVLAVLCIVASCVITQYGGNGGTAYVYKDGKLIKTLALKDEPYMVDLGTNTICVEHDGVSMHSATCPDKLCVKQGKIKNSSRSIVCLPNRIVVEIPSEKGEVDAVAGR